MAHLQRRGFTLIEIIIGAMVLILFFGSAYRIFIAGSKSSEKARWINQSVSQLRNTCNQVQMLLKQTSYPSTLQADAVKEAGTNAAQAPRWYVKVFPEGTITSESIGEGGKKKLLEFYVCHSEQPGKKGKIVRYQFWLEVKKIAFATVGELFMHENTTEFQLLPSGKNASDSAAAIPEPTDTENLRKLRLAEDITTVTFTVGGSLPAEEPIPLKISLGARNPMDPNTHKENETMATPNVGIRNLP
jgi:type II secretory pathway pseudopilin PulG